MPWRAILGSLLALWFPSAVTGKSPTQIPCECEYQRAVEPFLAKYRVPRRQGTGRSTNSRMTPPSPRGCRMLLQRPKWLLQNATNRGRDENSQAGTRLDGRLPHTHGPPQPSAADRVVIRRLNLAEQHARDLLGVTLRPADDFPPSPGTRFDTVGGTRSRCRALVEKVPRGRRDRGADGVFGVGPMGPSGVPHQAVVLRGRLLQELGP